VGAVGAVVVVGKAGGIRGAEAEGAIGVAAGRAHGRGEMGDEAGREGGIGGGQDEGDELGGGGRETRTGQAPVRGGEGEQRGVGAEEGIGGGEGGGGEEGGVLDGVEDVEVRQRPADKKHDDRLNRHVRWPQQQHSPLTPLFRVSYIYSSAHPVIIYCI